MRFPIMGKLIHDIRTVTDPRQFYSGGDFFAVE